MPGLGTQLESDLLDVLAVIFLDAEYATRARAAVTAAAGNPAAELLLGLLAPEPLRPHPPRSHPAVPAIPAC